ncbi:MAG: hypothetical protein KatS3mg002_0129 [Candidatus Woesearchaeota archaeon]|nr:MAG: hypothetical protein KatS3mg002_0129 [Candidatus Woesearchaeota archaeon]
MSIENITQGIDDKVKEIEEKVHSMEKELLELYKQYSKSISRYVKVVEGKTVYALQPTPSELPTYKLSYKKKTGLLSSVSGDALISREYTMYYGWTPLSPSYITALKKLKDEMIKRIDHKKKELDDLEKKLIE